MLTKLSNTLTKMATGKNILSLLVLFILFAAVILPALESRIKAESGGVGPIDLLFSYTPEQAYEMIEAYGEDGRTLYLIIELTADTLYPIVYALFLSLLITYLFRRAFASNHVWQRSHFLPLAVLLADYLENVGIVMMLLLYPAQQVTIAQVTALFTNAKWLLFGATLITVMVGLLTFGIKKVAGK